MRTTQGSLIYADHVPDADDIAVARLRAAGAILIGKTNVPEFGYGPRSTNKLFGPTANPYAPSLSSGGSSGGSAAALSAGMVPLAFGTDFGGSVRTPASFCGVVGLRPTPGFIPVADKPMAWNTLSTHGVMARTVADAAMMLDAIGGYDRGDPLSHPRTATLAVADIAEPAAVRVAFSEDFGVAPVAQDVRGLFRHAIADVASVFPAVAAAPDCTGAIDAFATLRAATLHRQFGALVRTRRQDLTPPLVWNVERGVGMTAETYLAAEEARSRVLSAFARFFADHDVLLTPAVSVMPFPNTQEEVVEIDGTPLASAIDYLSITAIVSLIGWPCLSIPCAWTAAGLPLGLQIVVPPWQESRLVAFAAALERLPAFRHRWPAES